MKTTHFSRNLKALRAVYNMSQSQLADALGVSKVAIGNYETRGAIPRMYIVDKLTELYGVTKQDMLGFTDGLYAKIHGLENIPKQAVMAASNTAFAPLLGRVHAGDWTDADVVNGEISCPEYIINRHPYGFFLEVEGDCMSRVFPEGCYVLVDPKKEPRSGEVACVRLDTWEVVMRRILRGRKNIMLVPDSYTEHDDIIIEQDTDITLVGTVVWFQAKEEIGAVVL